MKIKTIVILSLTLMTSFIAHAEPYGSHASDRWQIWAYSTAAPSFIGNFATIMGQNGKVLREGSNGWTCTATKPVSYTHLTLPTTPYV